MIYDVIIGACLAGLFTVTNIKCKKVLIFDKNKEPGRKLLLSRAGQCNYTNNCNINEFLCKYGDKSRFIKPTLYNFTNNDTINFFAKKGLSSTIREDNKVFPQTFKSSDMLNSLIDSATHT